MIEWVSDNAIKRILEDTLCVVFIILSRGLFQTAKGGVLQNWNNYGRAHTHEGSILSKCGVIRGMLLS